MYKVNLAFFDDLMRIDVRDDEGGLVFRAVTMLAPLLALCALGTDYAVEAVAPALPHSLTIRVGGEDVLITNPADPDRPILLKKADLLAAGVKGQAHGKEKQVVERPNTYPGAAEGRHLRIVPGVPPAGYGPPFTYPPRPEGADGQSGPSEAAPV